MLVVSVPTASGLSLPATAADVHCSVENNCSVFGHHISSRQVSSCTLCSAVLLISSVIYNVSSHAMCLFQGGYGARNKDPADTAVVVIHCFICNLIYCGDTLIYSY